MGWLDGQVALITGGGSGIGRAIVERYIEEGARVGVMDRFPDRIGQLREDFGEFLVGIPGDVARLDDNKAAVAETVHQFGRLDIYAGNAGGLRQQPHHRRYSGGTTERLLRRVVRSQRQGPAIGNQGRAPRTQEDPGMHCVHRLGGRHQFRRRRAHILPHPSTP